MLDVHCVLEGNEGVVANLEDEVVEDEILEDEVVEDEVVEDDLAKNVTN